MFDLPGPPNPVEITPPDPENGKRGLSVGKISVILAGIVLFAACNALTDKILTVEFFKLKIQAVIPLLCGFIMGPAEGFLVGFAGNFISDSLGGVSVKFAFSYSMGSGIFGCMMGFYGGHFRYLDNPRALTAFFAYILLTFSVGVLYSVAAESVLLGTNFLAEMERIGIPVIVASFFAAVSVIPPLFYFTGRIRRTIANRFILFLYYFALILAIGSVAATFAFLKEESGIPEANIPALLFMCDILLIPVFVITLASFFVAHRVTRKVMEPLSNLSGEIVRIADGGFSDRIKVSHEGIIQDLAESFNEMTDKLAVYSEEIERTARDKERMRTELSVAAGIQSMLLPEAEDENQDADVEIYGRMIPEKEIGGDFFNYSFMEGGRLFFVVADVSGHGIPAALFMMVADLLLLSLIQTGPDIGNVFTVLNRRLCEKNREGYFVTAFAGILETATGRLKYVNAGHNPPYVKSAALNPDGFRELPCEVNFVLGGLDGIVYTSRETTLRKGDFLFVYTDGVTEAMNRDLELFSKRRLEAALTSVIDENPDATPKEMVDRVFEEITRFSENTEHTDDITMLGVKL